MCCQQVPRVADVEGEIVYPKNSLRGLPADKALRFEYISDICKSMRRVIVAQEGTVPRSDWFNPFKLECRCYAGRHDGICAHVIAINSFKDPEQIGLQKWIKEATRRGQGSTGHTKKFHYLCKNGSTEDDQDNDGVPQVTAEAEEEESDTDALAGDDESDDSDASTNA